jgi:hypothetical protein
MFRAEGNRKVTQGDTHQKTRHPTQVLFLHDLGFARSPRLNCSKDLAMGMKPPPVEAEASIPLAELVLQLCMVRAQIPLFLSLYYLCFLVKALDRG